MCAVVNLKFLIESEWKGEKYVVDWLMENELIPNKVNCSKCGKLMKLVPVKDGTDGYIWICRVYKESVKHILKKSVRRDTCFFNNHFTLSVILQMTYLWVKNCSNEFIADEVHVNKNAVIQWKVFCQEVCMEMCIRENVMLGGPGTIIEVVETELDLKKNLGKKKVKGKCAYGGIERGTNKLFFKVVANDEQNILPSLIQKHILPGSIIISDCWRKYNNFNSSSLDLDVYQNFILKIPETTADVETINGICDVIRNELQGNAHAVNHLDLYLAEYVWKKRHEDGPDDIFKSFIKATTEVCKSGLTAEGKFQDLQ